MNTQKKKIHVIGINSYEFQDIPSNQQELILNTKRIAIPESYIKQIKKWFSENNSEKIFFESKSNIKLIGWLKESEDDIVLISRGDPLWFGIGRILMENFSKDELCFYPSNTCVQLACSQLKISWQDIKCISIHGRDSSELVKALKTRKSSIAIIPDSKKNSLHLIRKNLIELGFNNDYEFWICEELGLRKERIRNIKIDEEFPNDISNLYIVILLKKFKSYIVSEMLPLFGLNDECFKTFDDRPNLITKREIRIQILADLEIPENGTLWDIGAGSGTIGLEAIKLRPNIELISIDKRLGTKNIIIENAKRLGVFPKEIIEGDINHILKSSFNKLSPPNRIVLGGCDKKTKIDVIYELSKSFKKGDIMVLPIITYEHLEEIKVVFQKLNFQTLINLIQTYKSVSINEGSRFEPNNPVFVMKAKKLF
tara:strand:+ start:2867 stop:4144 length:1278 start_codon:yes stop_codon:yes gene_type:complete